MFLCTWKDLRLGLFELSVISSLLFNIYLNDLFLLLNDVKICNFADNTTAYIYDKNLQNISKSLKENFMPVILWFEKYCLKW